MNWHKTNLALIAILLLINIFMAVMLTNAYRDTRFVPREMVVQSRENLGARGIHFDDDAIDMEIKNQKVYTFSNEVLLHEAEDGEQSRRCLVNALSHLSKKSRQSTIENTQYFEIPEGITATVTEKDGTPIISVMISGKTNRENPDFRYLNNEFDYAAHASAIAQAYSYQTDMKSVSLPDEISSFIKAVYDGEIDVSLKSYQISGDTEVCLCSYTIDGIEISDMSSVFCIRENELVYICGDFFFNIPKAEYSARTVDGINVLFGITDIQNEISILSEHIEYSVFETETLRYYLVPNWVVKYREIRDTSSEQLAESFTFNALTGKPNIKE